MVIRTPDPERAAALYGARLGLDMRLDRSNPTWGARLMFFRCGDLIVELAHDLRAGVSAGPDRLWGLSWRRTTPPAAIARLRGAGLDVSDTRPGRKPGTHVFTVRDGTCGVPTLMLQPSGPPGLVHRADGFSYSRVGSPVQGRQRAEGGQAARVSIRADSPSASPATRARARSGMSRWRTPNGRSASTTALTTAGVEPMVAASPMPLAPSGLNGDGVTVWSVANDGKSSARGIA